MKNEFTKRQQVTIDRCHGRLKDMIILEYREMNKLKNSNMVKEFNRAEKQRCKMVEAKCAGVI